MNEKKEDSIDDLIFENVLLDSLPNPVYYKDTVGRFIRCNECFSSLVGAPKEDIIGNLAYEYFPKDITDRHRIIDQDIMATYGKYEDEIVFIKKDGTIKYFTLNKSVYLNQDGSLGGIVCVMNDITKKTKEKELVIQKSKFSEMGEMIASIAHQWNEPLVELSGLTQKIEFLYKKNKINKSNMHEFVNDSMIQIKYMSETLSDFRNFLKPSTMKETFGLKKAIKEIFDIIGKQIFYFNINVDFKYENKPEEEIFIYAYKNEFKQVILNIINNAKNKLVNLEEKDDFKGLITIEAFSEKNDVFIKITDNGGAIDNNILKHIFEPFFTTKDSGTGFGLYMARVIIEEKNHGKIYVENDYNNVIFTIKIPKEIK